MLFFGLLFAGSRQALAATTPSLPAPRPRVEAVRHEIQSILADQRFSYPDYLTWWRKLWSRIFQWLAGLNKRRPFQKMPGEALLSNVLNYFGLVLLLLLPVALVFLTPRLFQKEPGGKPPAQSRHLATADVGQLLQKAAFLAEQGLTLEALRHVYLAVLEHFKKVELLRRDVNYSDKEHLLLARKAFGPDHRAYVSFAQLIRLFQEKWYGLKDCGRPDYETACALAETIMGHAGRHHA